MEHEVVKLCTVTDNMQAAMILEALKEVDIPAYKKDLGNAGLMNLYCGNSYAGEEIYVADVNEQRAREVLVNIGVEE